MNVPRKDLDSKRGGSERDLWAGWGSLPRRRVAPTPPAKSHALQRLEIISQTHKGFGTKQKDSNVIAKKFSEIERNRRKDDNAKQEAEERKEAVIQKKIRKNDRKRKGRVEPNMSQHHEEEGANGERVGEERLQAARSTIQASRSSPLVGPAPPPPPPPPAGRWPIQANSSPPAGGIHTTNGPQQARLSFEQTMAQFGFRPRILQLEKGAALVPLSPDKDLVRGKDKSKAPPFNVPIIGKGRNNDERQDKTKRRNSRKLGVTQNSNVFTAFSNPSTQVPKFSKSFTGKVSELKKVSRKEKLPAFTAFTAFSSPPPTPGWVSYSPHSQEPSEKSEKEKLVKPKKNGEKTTPSAFKADRLFPHSKRVILEGKSKKRVGGRPHLDAGKPFLPTPPLSPAYQPFVRLTRKAIGGNVKSGDSPELKKSGEKQAAAGNQNTEDGFEDSFGRKTEKVGREERKSVCESLIFDVYRLLGGRVSRGC